MYFNSDEYTDETLKSRDCILHYRAYRNVPYVSNPVCERLQVLNIFIPIQYINGQTVNNYTSNTAPIFFPNAIGGYMEANPCSPYVKENGDFNTEALALKRGYVVISAGVRGRTTTDESGKFIGKAPSCIVDLKAAVRFVRSIADKICGDVNKIVSNGTSAGGAMSALLGASGDCEEYEAYLSQIGAANQSDSIFASSCYCPITNLENADSAYEWQYGHLNCNHWTRWNSDNTTTEMIDYFSLKQKQHSEDLKHIFAEYVEMLKLKDAHTLLLLEEFICTKLIESAKKAEQEGECISKECGIYLAENKMNFALYNSYITRMKTVCCFDNPHAFTCENELFGNEFENVRHFTDYGFQNDLACIQRAPEMTVFLMNAMNFVGRKGCVKHWRIRHGAADRDTSFAISACLTLKLEECGYSVDYSLPWGVEHSGDYDLNELFDWIDFICKR